MTEHRHPEVVEWCYRCDLGKEEEQRSIDLDALENVISKALDRCRFPEDLAIDAADAVITWANTTAEGRAVFMRAIGIKENIR